MLSTLEFEQRHLDNYSRIRLLSAYVTALGHVDHKWGDERDEHVHIGLEVNVHRRGCRFRQP